MNEATRDCIVNCAALLAIFVIIVIALEWTGVVSW